RADHVVRVRARSGATGSLRSLDSRDLLIRSLSLAVLTHFRSAHTTRGTTTIAAKILPLSRRSPRDSRHLHETRLSLLPAGARLLQLKRNFLHRSRRANQ